MQAGLFLKNMVFGKDVKYVREHQKQWKSVNPVQRGKIKEALLHAMASPEPDAPKAAAIAASEIAAVELPYGEWNEFVPALTDRVTQHGGGGGGGAGSTEVVPFAALQCLGFTCERVANLEEQLADDPPPELSSGIVDKMLTAIVSGVQPNRSDYLRSVAIAALRNSLVFVRKNMDVKQERDFIMNAIFDATQCNDMTVRKVAFECMDTIGLYYYEKLPDYMTGIFQLTSEAIRRPADGSDEEAVNIAAIEFWSTVATVEREYLDEERDFAEAGEQLTHRPPCNRYTQNAMPTLVPLLLETLTKQEDESVENEDEWNLVAAGACCLEAIASTVEDQIVQAVVPFVEHHIHSQDWRCRDAAVVAFQAILEGPSTDAIAQYVSQAVPTILSLFRDPIEVVRDSATHCIAKILLHHIGAVSPELLTGIVHGLIEKLTEVKSKVASHSCGAIFNLAQSVRKAQQEAGDEVPPNNLLSAPMMPLMQALLGASDRSDSGDSNLRIASMSALAELVSAGAQDVQSIFLQFLPEIIRRLERALTVHTISVEEHDMKDQLLGLLCALLTVLFQRLDRSDIAPHADHIMGLLLQVMQIRSMNCGEEALLSTGALAGVLEGDFQVRVCAVFF